MSSDKTSSLTETLVSDAGMCVMEKVLSRLAGREEDEDMADIDGGSDEDLTASLPHQEATEDADEYNIGTFEDDETGVSFPSSFRTTTSSDSNPDDPNTALPHHGKDFNMSPFRAALSLYAKCGMLVARNGKISAVCFIYWKLCLQKSLCYQSE